MGCCNDKNLVFSPNKGQIGTPRDNRVSAVMKSLRLQQCLGCPHRLQPGGKKPGIQKEDLCGYDNMGLRNKAKLRNQACNAQRWPSIELEQDLIPEMSAIDKLKSLSTAGLDYITSGYVPQEVMDERRKHCLECVYRIPKSDNLEKSDTMISDSDICGICTCPVLSITQLSRKACPDNPSKWGQHKAI